MVEFLCFRCMFYFSFQIFLLSFFLSHSNFLKAVFVSSKGEGATGSE
jgi:hypothetical protein